MTTKKAHSPKRVVKYRMLKAGDVLAYGDKGKVHILDAHRFFANYKLTQDDVEEYTFRRPIQPKRKTKEGKSK